MFESDQSTRRNTDKSTLSMPGLAAVLDDTNLMEEDLDLNDTFIGDSVPTFKTKLTQVLELQSKEDENLFAGNNLLSFHRRNAIVP